MNGAGALGLKLSDDFKFLAGFTGSGDIAVWNLSSRERSPLGRAFAPLSNFKAGAFSYDNRRIAAAAEWDGGFIWDRVTQRRIVLPRVQTDYTSFSYSPDGTRLAAGSDGQAKIFDAATAETLLSFKQQGLKLAFLPDNEGLLAIHATGASVLRAPALSSFKSVGWLGKTPSEDPLEYVGPKPPGVEFAVPVRDRSGK
jgi:WD40 repeat protein